MQQRLTYMTPQGTADAKEAAFPTIAAMYKTLDDLRAVLRPGEALVELSAREDKVDRRLDLTVALDGAAATFMDERIYIVSSTRLDATDGLLVELVGELQWKIGTAIPAGVGARTGHKLTSTVSIISDSGLLVARTGTALKIISHEPSFVQLTGLGSVTAIVRVFKDSAVSPADGVSPLGRVWF